MFVIFSQSLTLAKLKFYNMLEAIFLRSRDTNIDELLRKAGEDDFSELYMHIIEFKNLIMQFNKSVVNV